MKFVSIDIETTGLDPFEDQVLEFAAVISNGHKDYTPHPVFHAVITRSRIGGNPYAIGLNARIIRWIANLDARPDPTKVLFVKPCNFETEFSRFLLDNGFSHNERIVAAGKNVRGFDLRFLFEEEATLLSGHTKFHHRALDPGPIYARLSDDVPPDLKECLVRAGISEDFIKAKLMRAGAWVPEGGIEHTAVGDAMAVALALETYYSLRNL